MCRRLLCRLLPAFVLLGGIAATAQTSFKPKYKNSTIYTGIEVGSKGVKLSVIEIGKNAQTSGAFNILKDSSANTDFISFSEHTFIATLNSMYGLFEKALKEYHIPSERIFTVISSGVKGQAEKENRNAWVNRLIDSFLVRINEPERKVDIVDVTREARLSHLGIIPETRRYSTFLIDVGSGNTKGGFFPYGNTEQFRLFELNWGTRSTANATDKQCGTDKSLSNFNKQLYRVLAGAENSEISYTVNASGAYPVSDNIAVSGGIAWALATLMHPEMLDNSVVPISFDELVKFYDQLYRNFDKTTPSSIAATMTRAEDKEMVQKEAAKVHQVFDQYSLLAGTGLLIKIMRQFHTTFETKNFFLVKNGQVGWVSAYVDQSVAK